ncbi:DUF1853 family protein [Photobacterium nomapromontoriensis]|uniref:DUF1853 family protein n=1 Tax=Photobacterium nomapromontoriensis TaxID=2910237 RepID=UPI003D145F08
MTLTYTRTAADKHSHNNFLAVLQLPPLLAGHPFIADPFWLEKFASHAVVPESITYQGNHRLGFFYQWLWQQLIIHHPHYELVAEEIQLHVDGKTVGAIDFLVTNSLTGQLEHWEVAIKFYLALGNSWPGPNAQDNLDKKAHRMLTHQLMLSHHSAYQQQLHHYYGQPAVKRLIMQGRLFFSTNKSNIGSDITINPSASTGQWCYAADSAHLTLQAIAKTDWIAPPPYSALCATPVLTTISHPTMAVAPDDTIWFVMPDNWPASSMKATDQA